MLKMLNKNGLKIFNVFVLIVLFNSPAVFGIRLTFKLSNYNDHIHENLLVNRSVTGDIQLSGLNYCR